MNRSLLIVFLIVWHMVAMAAVDTKVEPAKALPSETIRLILTVNDASAAGSVPDLSPLQRAFHIVGRQQSMSYSVSNGQAHAVTQWIILLTAKQTGVVPIPAIQIGAFKSAATQVEIMSTTDRKSAAPGSPSQNAVILQTEVNVDHPFINEQVIYTVKLFHNQRLIDAQYQPPKIDDALLFPLDDGQSYQGTLNGKIYAVEEQRYAVFPQKSGTLRLIAPTFEALLYNGDSQHVRAMAKTIELQVKPIPAHAQGKPWLPAKQVKLTQVYANHEPTLSEGDTLVRTVTLQAVGVPAQLLPGLEFSGNEHVKVYPEKPNFDNAIRQNELISNPVY